jgi:hypothetical protein
MLKLINILIEIKSKCRFSYLTEEEYFKSIF